MRLVRTRATYLVYASLGFYGWFIYGFGPVVPLIRDEQGTSRAVAGLHSTALAAGALVAGALYPVLARRIGRSNTLYGTVLGLGLGIVLLVSVPSAPAVTIAATLCCGIVGSTLVNVAPPALLDVHGAETSGAALVEGNAIATGTGLIAPLAVGLALDHGYGWRPALLVASVLAAVILVVGRSTGARLPSPPLHSDDGRRTEVVNAALPGRYWIAWGVTLCCIAAEFATTLWASDVLRDRTGASAALATAAVTAVVGGMCAGRIVGALLAARLPGFVVLLPALGVALAGTAVFWGVTAAGWAIVGLAVLGLGLGPLFPLSVDLALRASGGQSDRAAGYSSYAAGLAIGGGPFILGALADVVGPHAAFLVVPALFAAAALGVLGVRRSTKSTLLPA
ncbi:MFS transporter [Cryptosporangium phraense]|uniref:MFS transporter n=1 Tax=Cryptosporangium phraense TaxID=2593070 RepID=UPI0014797CEF|nr:MFS transporter [Cryptosporangium phraense]